MRPPEFWHAGRGGWAGALLAPFGSIYGNLVTARANRAPGWRAPAPVICVGNVVLGGAGKTQVAVDVLARLSAAGIDAHAILRGYGGRLSGPCRVEPGTHSASDVGDEALILTRHAPTWIGADRVAAARAAVEAGAEAIVMDDGLQNPSLAKTLSLLVIDGGYGVGNGRVFPAGPLRERPAAALNRANAVCVIGGNAPAAVKDGDKPVFPGETMPAPDAPDVDGRRVLAFAGIGRPEKFFETLRQAGADLVRTQAFPDHHAFAAGEIAALIAEASRNEAIALTTEKDHVRLPKDIQSQVATYPVRLAWRDPDAFDALLRKTAEGG